MGREKGERNGEKKEERETSKKRWGWVWGKRREEIPFSLIYPIKFLRNPLK